VCLSVYWDTGELCKNSCTDRDTVGEADSCGFKEPCIRLGQDPHGNGQFGSCPATENHSESLLLCMQPNGSFNVQ